MPHVGEYISRLPQVRLSTVSSSTLCPSAVHLTYCAYNSLVCTITWNNVEGLMNISHKLSVPSLQQECLTFLLKSAAGRPIKALRIAELFEEEELYREASRFVLDNPGGWSEHELNTLSQETLLKLEKRCASCAPADPSLLKSRTLRRNWFLERVLKLGLTMIAKEYQCVSPYIDTLPSIRGIHSPVPILPRFNQLCSPARREMATSLPCCLQIRCAATVRLNKHSS